MPNLKLVLEYDGTEFSGWQAQPGRRTVQGVLEAAAREVTGRAVRFAVAGRTDAGVHAAGQVASADLRWAHGPERLAAALNARLPSDVAVLSAAAAPPRFDARRDARERAYRYAILNHPARSPLLGRHAAWVPRPLNVRGMAAAARLFRGRHDFTAFCTREAGRNGAVRRLTRVTLRRTGPLLLLDVAGGSFLHRMVRLMAGALLAVGAGRLAPRAVRAALRGRGPGAPLAPAAPAHGLALLHVRYGPRPDAARLGWPPGCNIPTARLV